MQKATEGHVKQIFELYKPLIDSQASLAPYFLKEAEQSEKSIS